MQVYLSLGISLGLALVNILFSRQERTVKNVIGIILLYLLVINIGLGGIIAFLGHAFMPDQIARSIGWAPGSPFQYEVAVADLAFGVLGVLCLWIRNDFWLAAGVAQAVFGWGAAVGHIREAILHGNFAINNVGPVLFIGDILLPLTVVVLLLIHRSLKN